MDQGEQTAFSSASRPMKYALSFAVFYCTFSLGIFTTSISPVAKEFESKFNASTDEVGTVFFVMLVAYLLGALTGGIVYNYVNRQIVVIFLLAMATACLFLFADVTSLTVFLVLGGIMGFGAGGFDTAQVAWIIDIWRHEAGPFILSQHFAYSLGTLVPPILFVPFLKGGTNVSTSNPTASVEDIENSTSGQEDSTELFIPFTITGCFGIVAVLIQIVLYFVFRRTSNPYFESINDGDCGEENKPEDHVVPAASLKAKTLLREKICIVFLGCCYIGFYQAMEQCTMQFLPQFAINSEVRLSESDAATVLFGLNIGFALGRGIGILTVLRFEPHVILTFNFLAVVTGNTILLLLGGSSLTWMWVGSICLGLGFSTMYPAFYAYLEKYLFVTDTIAAIITVSGGFVSSFYPLIVKKYVVEYPKVLNYMDYVSFTVTLLTFVALYRFTRRKRGHEVLTEHND